MVLPAQNDGVQQPQDLTNVFPEDGLNLPWVIDKDSSYLDYRCWLEVSLDAGMALHKPLPQSAAEVDTLATAYFLDQGFDTAAPASGVNISSFSQATDVIQRMATSTYTFILRGWGMRAGYQIPIPGLRSVGGVAAVPGEIQRGYNVPVGNLGGIPVWFATWELHYILPQAPRASPGLGNQAGSLAAPVPPNPALHLRPDAKLPLSVRLPWTTVDSLDKSQQQTLQAQLANPLARLR
jgi:hypothetical protein